MHNFWCSKKQGFFKSYCDGRTDWKIIDLKINSCKSKLIGFLFITSKINMWKLKSKEEAESTTDSKISEFYDNSNVRKEGNILDLLNIWK